MRNAKNKMWRAIAALIFYASVLPASLLAQEAPTNVFGLIDCSKASNLLSNALVCIQLSTTGGRTIGHIYTWSLATSTFTDITAGTGTVTSISTTSPIGRALLGKQVGETATVITPNGKRELEILKLLTIHDGAE